jgi:ribonuclease HII
LYDRIVAEARFWAVGEASVTEIDRINILQATLFAMRRALDMCSLSWTLALIDGNQPLPGLAPDRQRTVVGGDTLSATIAAASIVAKVTRDRIMLHFHERFPQYGFYSHKGYGTAVHRQRIMDHGMSEIHRRSFCERFVSQTESVV